MSGLTEVAENTMMMSHLAGRHYWKRNRPYDATEEGIASLARSRGWHGGDCYAFVAGFFGEKRRDQRPLRWNDSGDIR
jgi:hypothetical protein